MDGMGWWMGVGWLAIVAVIVLFALIVTGPSTSPGSRGREPEPTRGEAILRERFARGEIDEDEYRARLDVLRHQGARAPR